MAKKTVSAADTQRELLAKELRGLIPRLDSEGLAFLTEQAKIHLYNMQVEKLNEEASVPTADADRSGTAKRAAKKTGSFKIRGTESGSSYYLYYGNNEVMFSRDEMIHLVKIANGAGSDLEIRERLYNWLDRERRDAFSVVPMADKFDERLKALAAFLKKNFKLRG
jgi:DNA integrity scanning protein DisA with diadenylate cyclase activity